jgi:hypothetical protein
MPFKARTFIRLADPSDPDDPGVVKAPGDKITKDEFTAAGQKDENIKSLLDSGAITENFDDEIDSVHAPVEPVYEGTDTHVIANDGGTGNE